VLNLRDEQQLAHVLKTPLRVLHGVLRRAEDYYEELVLTNPHGKDRRVASPCGPLRRLQTRFHVEVLSPLLDRSPYSHGGVPGRNVLTNVRPHLGQRFIFTADVTEFYPSIRRERIHDLFMRLGCSAEVARLATRLCTYRHRLAQGLVTSPILADQLMRPVDERIAKACERLGLIYTRFVDDLAISGPFDLSMSGVPNLVRRILQVHGFECNPAKDQFGCASRGATVTQIRFPNGHPDVRSAYLSEVERQIQDAASLACAGPFTGPYFTEAQILGRLAFICWVNPRRRKRLFGLLRRVDWRRHREQARRLGLEREVARRVVRKLKKGKGPFTPLEDP
jgi:hypothetical protein